MSENNKKLKLFISYSHLDEEQINQFIKHLAPLKNNGLIEDWYDRKIIPGKDFQKHIDNNLEDADILCLCISANFLDSAECMKEKQNALTLKKKNGIAVIPIILSPCGWLDDKDLSKLLALPTDGKPVSTLSDNNSGWQDVYKGLKKVIEEEIKIRNIKITNHFSSFLQSTDLLTKAHSEKEAVFLDDIFVYPDLAVYDDLREFETKHNARELFENFFDYEKVLIASEAQAGKTSLCKKFFNEWRKKHFIPVYLSDKQKQYLGNIENKINKAISEQYEDTKREDIENDKIVLIIDDFHFAKHKEKHIQNLKDYPYQILIVDDIFALNIKNENLIKEYTHFEIRPFKPSLRNELITIWTNLSDSVQPVQKNENYQKIDKTTELVNTVLGKLIDNGIMPSYPFFILSVISSYEAFQKPLDKEITSQGYCYEALIYLYLRKEGVENDDIDTYINVLTHLSYYFYSERKSEISTDDLEKFFITYKEKFNLPVPKQEVLRKLVHARIIGLDSFNNYTFCYKYLYYFFVARYLARALEDAQIKEKVKKTIDSIIGNLHKNENAYIAIFLTHHSQKDLILDEIILNAECLFENHPPASLNIEELKFFDEQEDKIIQAVLPLSNHSPEKEREKRLKAKDEIEEHNVNNETEEPGEEDDELARELRRSIKTVEVMGSIIKNRAGSLPKEKIETVFQEGMKIHLRILSSFFALIRERENQNEIVEMIKERLDAIIKKKQKTPNKEQLEKMSRAIFWNINFFTIFHHLHKIIHSLGSDKLRETIAKVCDTQNTPAAAIIKHGILMWYDKNLQVVNITDRVNKDGFSKTARNLMNFLIVEHCMLHKIGYKDINKLHDKLKIPKNKLLISKPNAK